MAIRAKWSEDDPWPTVIHSSGGGKEAAEGRTRHNDQNTHLFPLVQTDAEYSSSTATELSTGPMSPGNVYHLQVSRAQGLLPIDTQSGVKVLIDERKQSTYVEQEVSSDEQEGGGSRNSLVEVLFSQGSSKRKGGQGEEWKGRGEGRGGGGRRGRIGGEGEGRGGERRGRRAGGRGEGRRGEGGRRGEEGEGERGEEEEGEEGKERIKELN